MIAIGIDPGLTGAVAVICEDKALELWDTPTIRVGRKRLPDIREMKRKLDIVSSWYQDPYFAALETQQAFPGQGVSSTFSIGMQYGIWQALLVSQGWPFELVRPQRWKRAMLDGLPTNDKNSSRVAACRLFPFADLGKRKDNGRADALLIAAFVFRVLKPWQTKND